MLEHAPWSAKLLAGSVWTSIVFGLQGTRKHKFVMALTNIFLAPILRLLTATQMALCQCWVHMMMLRQLLVMSIKGGNQRPGAFRSTLRYGMPTFLNSLISERIVEKRKSGLEISSMLFGSPIVVSSVFRTTTNVLNHEWTAWGVLRLMPMVAVLSQWSFWNAWSLW